MALSNVRGARANLTRTTNPIRLFVCLNPKFVSPSKSKHTAFPANSGQTRLQLFPYRTACMESIKFGIFSDLFEQIEQAEQAERFACFKIYTINVQFILIRCKCNTFFSQLMKAHIVLIMQLWIWKSMEKCTASWLECLWVK